MIQVVLEKEVPSRRQNYIKVDVKKYNSYFGKTEVGKKYKPVLDAMLSPKGKSGHGAYRPGLVGRYYKSHDTNSKPEVRVDAKIYFDWGQNAAVQGGPKENFSIVWEGFIRAPSTGEYVFYCKVDDSATIEIDGRQILARAGTSPPIKLKSGIYTPIKIKYAEHGLMAHIQLEWSSVSIKKQPLDSRYLFHLPAQAVAP